MKPRSSLRLWPWFAPAIAAPSAVDTLHLRRGKLASIGSDLVVDCENDDVLIEASGGSRPKAITRRCTTQLSGLLWGLFEDPFGVTCEAPAGVDCAVAPIPNAGSDSVEELGLALVLSENFLAREVVRDERDGWLEVRLSATHDFEGKIDSIPLRARHKSSWLEGSFL